jgi:hypothetical protein
MTPSTPSGNPVASGALRPRTPGRRALLALERLEERLALYSVSGNAWPAPQLITISFMPDGTSVNGQSSNLFSTFTAKFGSAATWQNQILKAAQYWAQQTNINFAVVPDNGAAGGSGSYQQGDPGFGDIRIGGYNFGATTLAQTYLPPPANNYSIAGDIQFNTAQPYNIGTTYDLFTVAMHEFGHALGLYHGAAGSVMDGTYTSVKPALTTDDVNGIRAIYSANAARADDAYDAGAASNDTSGAATLLTTQIDPVTNAGVVNNMDLTTTTDVDWFKFVVPLGTSGTLRAKAVSQGLSLLSPKVEIYNSALTLVASGNTTAYGGTATATLTGIVTGQTYYVKVSSTAAIAAFKTGQYGLVLNMGAGADPTVTPPITQLANGTPLMAGGGQPTVIAYDVAANTTTAGVQQTNATGQSAVAASPAGNYVVTWASQDQDGSGWGVYAQRFDYQGNRIGGEFRVNTTTAGDQVNPTVAMDQLGNYVIAWESYGQDGSGWGVYARRYTAWGGAQGPEFLVNTTTAGNQNAPSVAEDNAGNFTVVWASDQGGSGTDIYERSFDKNGVAQGNEVLVNDTTAGNQVSPAVVRNRTTGDFIITWASQGQDGGGWCIYAKRYNAAGQVLITTVNSALTGNKASSAPTGAAVQRMSTRDTVTGSGEFLVNTTTTGDQTAPAIGIDRTSGEFVISWTGPGNGVAGGLDVFAQRFDSSGNAVGGEFRVNSTTASDQTGSSVAIDSGGNILITWSSNGQDGSGWGVVGQLFSPDGTPRDGELALNTTAAGDQRQASVTIADLGRAIVAWSGNGPSDASGVFFRRIDMTQEALEASGDVGSAPDVIAPAQGGDPAGPAQAFAHAGAADARRGNDFAGLFALINETPENAPAFAGRSEPARHEDGEGALVSHEVTPARGREQAAGEQAGVRSEDERRGNKEDVSDLVFAESLTLQMAD